MRLIFPFILLIITEFSGFSQTSAISNLSDLSDQFTLEKSKRNFMNGPDIEGSPYLDDQFSPGEIVVSDSLIIKDVPLRYNIYNDRFEFLNEDDQVLEIGTSDNDFIYRISDKTFTTINYSDRGADKRGILELLVDGNIRLYKQYLVHYKEATKTIGYQEALPHRFIRQNDDYLLAIEQNKPETIRKTKTLLEELKPFKSDIEQYKDSEKLKLKTEEGLIQLIEYCND